MVLRVQALKILTLGIYHFWGKTRIRRYLWSQTAWEGERLVYTGTGKELLLGYLRAFLLVILPLYGAGFGASLVGERYPVVAVIFGPAAWFGFMYLTGVALYSAWRYRLSRTLWRGIRFGLTGSAWSYGGQFLLETLLVLCTFGFYTPYMQVKLTGVVINDARFGTEAFMYSGRGKDLKRIFLRTVGYSVLIGVGAIALVILLPALVHFGGGSRSDLALMFLPILIVVAIAGGVVPLWIAYQGAQLRYHVEHTRLGPLQFQLDFRWPAYLRLALGNLSLVVFTLGLGLPLAAMRTARFAATRLKAAGTLDYATIAQNQQPLSRTGEGLSQAFDLGSL